MSVFRIMEQVREWNIAKILDIAESIRQSGFAASEPLVVYPEGNDDDEAGYDHPADVIAELFKEKETIKLGGSTLKLETIVSRLNEADIEKFIVCGGRHRAVSLALLHAFGMMVGKVPTVRVKESEASKASLFENAVKMHVARLTSTDLLSESLRLSKTIAVTEGLLQSLGVKRGSAQKTYAATRLILEHALPKDDVARLDKEQARKCLKDCQTAASQLDKEAILSEYVASGSKREPMLNRKDLDDLVKFCNDNKQDCIAELIEAIQANSLVKAKLVIKSWADLSDKFRDVIAKARVKGDDAKGDEVKGDEVKGDEAN